MENAIAICAPGVELNRIGDEVQKVAEKYNYGVVPCKFAMCYMKS